jgi:hypothetical protein
MGLVVGQRTAPHPHHIFPQSPRLQAALNAIFGPNFNIHDFVVPGVSYQPAHGPYSAVTVARVQALRVLGIQIPPGGGEWNARVAVHSPIGHSQRNVVNRPREFWQTGAAARVSL